MLIIPPEILERILFELVEECPAISADQPSRNFEFPSFAQSVGHKALVGSVVYAGRSLNKASVRPLWQRVIVRSARVQRAVLQKINGGLPAASPRTTVHLTIGVECLDEQSVLAKILAHMPNLAHLSIDGGSYQAGDPLMFVDPCVVTSIAMHLPRLQALVLTGTSLLLRSADAIVLGSCSSLEYFHVTNIVDNPHGLEAPPLPIVTKEGLFGRVTTLSLGSSASYHPPELSMDTVKPIFIAPASLGSLQRLNLLSFSSQRFDMDWMLRKLNGLVNLEVYVDSEIVEHLPRFGSMRRLTLHSSVGGMRRPSSRSVQEILFIFHSIDEVIAHDRARVQSYLSMLRGEFANLPRLRSVEVTVPRSHHVNMISYSPYIHSFSLQNVSLRFHLV